MLRETIFFVFIALILFMPIIHTKVENKGRKESKQKKHTVTTTTHKAKSSVESDIIDLELNLYIQLCNAIVQDIE